MREASLHAIVDSLLIKLREPWTPLAYLGTVTSPASYRAVAAVMPSVFPSPRAPTPAAIDALVRETARLRGLTFVDDTRWLVRSLGAPRYPERLKRSQRLRDDHHARFYMDWNPSFDDGTAMLMWVPLDLASLCGGIVRCWLGASG